MALGRRGMTVEAARECERSIFSWPCVLWDRPSTLCWVITWREVGCPYMMQLRQTIKGAQLLKVNARVPSIWLRGVC